ncbi:amine oxidase [Neosynechococcus sphagnicola sy1]|uniref:Amine oxidase n=1 Tax=Neosynechococcus sphagnicola sy1 TaxID=1497020 RepID=A0A098TLD3_9CYAN|nr:FAD-dependent oxidoreductase [Neosynechococcus sphagnicola]KGF73120.1 amine oxidase [Neosynechococcus sphagnicola sy1]
MKIAIIGGGASGLVTAYWLDQQGHHVTVIEQQPVLGGHIRTLNKNVQPNHSNCEQILENGVLEFPVVFYNFLHLMQELGVELEPVDIGSALFLQDGRHLLSGKMIQKNFSGLQRLIEYLRLDTLYARSAGFWMKMRFTKMQDFYDQAMEEHLKQPGLRNCWLKLLTMYSYSMPFELIGNFPAELAMPALREYIFVKWVRIKGGVYSYVEKILARFRGELWLNTAVAAINRTSDGVKIRLAEGAMVKDRSPSIATFDKVVFATPPDQVMHLLADATDAETRRFSAWRANRVQTVLHTDTAMYNRYGIQQMSEFDFFQTAKGWGYNAALNQLCGITASGNSPPENYSLAFNLESLISPDRILHIQQHHTPLFTVEAFKYRDEVVSTNGENHTYHAGAYLSDGLHEGAVTSALRVAQLIGKG